VKAGNEDARLTAHMTTLSETWSHEAQCASCCRVPSSVWAPFVGDQDDSPSVRAQRISGVTMATAEG
jgi:hypothetical protein